MRREVEAPATTTSYGDGPSCRRQRDDHVWVRELRAGEFDILDAVFNGLSASSRFDRFHSGNPRLSPLLRNHLSAVDGYRHVAVAAFAGRQPVGIARLIALGGRHAEMAIEVVDTWQGRGIGTCLLRAVTDRGRALGYTEILADVLADNVAAQRLLASVFPTSTTVHGGPEIAFTVDLTTDDPTAIAAA